LILAWCGAALPADLIGQASIIDGDTLEIQGTRIRLWGIDAPECSQLCRGDDSVSYRCGTKSANALDALIAKRPVSCVPVSLDQYGRTVATARWLGSILPTGLSAMALRWIGRAIPTAGTDAQRDAEHAVRGIWAGSYFAPWLYRARIRAGGTPRSCSDDANAHP
jgi:endonuclease YncB( thermonuclease family)